jgi:outer membrane protein TolC
VARLREALKVAELESETTKFDTMSAVGLLYIETLKAEATVNTRNANMQLFEELLELARSRRGGGMGTGLDTARLEAQLEMSANNWLWHGLRSRTTQGEHSAWVGVCIRCPIDTH